MLRDLIERVKDEPVLTLDLFKALVALAVAAGVPLGAELKAALVGVVLAALSFATRQKVKPNRKAEVERQDARLEGYTHGVLDMQQVNGDI